MKKSFTDRLTPGQVQTILTELGIPWQNYKPNESGWIQIPEDVVEWGSGYLTHSDLGVNVEHGGFCDHYTKGTLDMGTGDLVHLVQLIRFEHINNAYADQAIEWITDILGLKKGVKAPELEGGLMFAKDFRQSSNEKFVMIPKDILSSDLSGSEKLVWAAIFDRCGKGNVYSYPGIRRISSDTGFSTGTVQRAISNLIEYGLLIEKTRGNRTNIAPARFPLVCEKAEINQRVKEAKKSACQYSNTPVSKVEHPCSRMDTELDSLTRPKKLDPESERVTSVEDHPRAVFSDSCFPSKEYETLFLLTAKNNATHYQRYVEEGVTAADLIAIGERSLEEMEYAAEMAKLEGYAA